MTGPVPPAIYCPDQYAGARAQDLQDEDEFGLLLHPVAWVDGSPVVTARAFANWVRAWAANDRNGNWGHVFEFNLVEGQHLVWVSGDAYARIKFDFPEGFPLVDGLCRAEVLDFDSEIAVWAAGDGGVYRLADSSSWSDWAPLESFDQFAR